MTVEPNRTHVFSCRTTAVNRSTASNLGQVIIPDAGMGTISVVNVVSTRYRHP